MLMKVNERFGFDLYSDFGNTLFYFILFIAVIAIVGAIVKRDGLFVVISMICCFAIVMYLFVVPDKFVDLGGWICGLVEDVFGGLYSKEVV